MGGRVGSSSKEIDVVLKAASKEIDAVLIQIMPRISQRTFFCISIHNYGDNLPSILTFCVMDRVVRNSV